MIDKGNRGVICKLSISRIVNFGFEVWLSLG